MIMDEFAMLVADTKKKIDEGIIANSEGVFLAQAIAQGYVLDEYEKKLLGQMTYMP